MPKNLVIVESPAKARTIERYLGADYQVLASYGHVRDLPENPGKGKFGVDVDHDFAPEYVDLRGPAQAGRRRSRRPPGAPTTSASPPTSTARARRSPGTSPRPPTSPRRRRRRVTFSEITEGAIREAFANPRDIDQRPRRRPAGPPDRRPPRRLHAEPAPVAQGPRRPVGRARPVGRRPPRRRARARDRRLHRARVLDARGDPRDRRRRRRSPPSSSGSTARPLDIGDGETAERHADGAPRRCGRSSTKVGDRAPRSAARRRRSRRRTLQQEASRKLGFSPKRTMSIAQRLYEGVDTPDGHVGLITYMRTDSTAIAGVAMGEAREVIRDRFGERVQRCRQGPGLQDEGEGRPGGARVDPADLASGATRTRCAGYLKPEELRALPADLAARARLADGAQGARDHDGRAGRRAVPSCARRRPRTLFDGFARVYTEGRDDDAPRTTEAGTPARRSPRATSRPSTTSRPTQHFTEPPPRFTEATLIKALEEHGIGRPSTYAATISTIVDRGYVRVEERRLHPEQVGGDRHGPPRRALRRLRGPRVHRPDGGGARRGRPRRARVGAAAARVLRPAASDRVDEKRKELKRARLHHRGDRRGLLRGPPDGHPARPQRPVPGLLARTRSTRRRGRCPARSRRARGRRRGLPAVRRGHAGRRSAAGSGRSSAARATRTALHPARTARRRPDQLPFEVTCPKNGDGHLVARRARRTGNVFWGCSELPEVRLHDERRAARARPRRHATTGPRRAARARPASA